MAAVRSEYSLWTRDVERSILPACRDLGVGFVAYSPLGRGFLTGTIERVDHLDPNDLRRLGPRFPNDNFARNLPLVAKVKPLALEKGRTPARLAIAWVLAQGVVPIPGSERRDHLEENLLSTRVELSSSDLHRIGAEMPIVRGERMDPAGMTTVEHWTANRAARPHLGTQEKVRSVRG